MMITYQGLKYHWSFKKFFFNLIIILFISFFWMVYISTIAKANANKRIIEVTVHRGDTLWSIAREIAPENDPRFIIEQIKKRNALSEKSLVVGQKLKIEVIRNI